MSLHVVDEEARADGFPRVSGDEPSGSSGGAKLVMFSPRERG